MYKEDGEIKDFTLGDGKTLIGRQEDCDLRIPLAEISRKHAVVMVDREAETITLRDLGSANGTYVNNVRISEQELEAGDHLVIGPVVFTVQIDGEPSDVRPVKTRLESRRASRAAAAPASPEDSDVIDADDLFDDEEGDPISELEALAGTDETAAMDLDDSDFAIDDDEDSKK
jgi:pSer/pThr/pTyr-binding forkhead associated (FHA) protein